MMSVSPGHRWLRFHVGTMVAVSLSFGSMLYLALRPRPLEMYDRKFLYHLYDEQYLLSIEGEEIVEVERGWPWTALQQADNPLLLHRPVRVWDDTNVVLDAITIVCLCCGVTFLSEFFIYRKNVRTVAT